ncbi:MAG: hypothetical protein U1E06_24670 [Tabrizicola sp.]|uniref:hypothetical protein n=1 Tax=Tabrizicola sp. TaxID=2005166 RepID=UPI0027357ADB|nr:hypothetical protein [Tabrizicola sp.]MDP3261368.1 hypothetical protein [Tabrizicola sp.]MDP3649157.1 hypothetical protein [Paracoccaceae bacterium]MDZ4069998.1 hypothetical protein [Tabrizicola sp.]
MQIGHNRGPSLEGGASWRRHCWAAARERLLPILPVEVVRLRVKRAKALGLDYGTYAGVRAATGHDVVAFLFSTNALRVTLVRPAMPEGRAEKLAAVTGCGRVALAVAPLTAGMVAAANPVLDAAHPAPWALAGFGEMRDALRAALGRVPADQVVLVGDLGLERDWCAAGRLAAYLPAERYFGH